MPSPTARAQPQSQSSQSNPPLPQLDSFAVISPHPSHQSHHTPSSVASASRLSNENRKPKSPFSFRRPFKPNPSSTSIVPSTAEGKPIPVDDSTAEHRTSALRELNNNYPSRHRYAKSTGAQNSTYSEPVIVRSYYSPQPGRPAVSRNGGSVRSGTVAGPDGPASATNTRRALPFANQASAAGNGMLSNMVRARAKKQSGGGSSSQHDAHLPPVEAFTFKSFIANMESQGAGSDISADLDRIAEICAKSRYSLSSQHEVHYAPHGSGTGFLGSSSRDAENHGPTLQAVSSDDDRASSTQRKRRMGPRRNSRAMGTLETIMSSSRSSEDDQSKKKSAAQLAMEVRGRANTRKESGQASSVPSSPNPLDEPNTQDEGLPPKPPTGRRSSSLALIDSSTQGSAPSETGTPRTSATALVGEPALPQASTRQLELRPTPEADSDDLHATASKSKPPETDGIASPFAKGAMSSVDEASTGTGLLSTLTGWMPWRSPDTSGKSHGRAEGSLRELLKTTNGKGKSVERIV